DPVAPPLWLPTPEIRRFRRAVRRLDGILNGMLRARRADPDTYGYASDLLSIMLRARDDWGEGMLEKHLRGELMSLYFAGHETTALTLTWTFYLLSQHPEVEQRVHDEVDLVLDERDVTAQDVDRLE